MATLPSGWKNRLVPLSNPAMSPYLPPRSLCPLCGQSCTQQLVSRRGTFLECATCLGVHRLREEWPSPQQERALYQTHENSVADPRYRRFLSRLADPLMARLASGACGLDFGSGPAPALCAMLSECGFPTVAHDPWFLPNESWTERTFDFITLTEVAEHLHEPARVLDDLLSHLRPHGLLAIMTEWYKGQTPFDDWRYARDPTHVFFYRRETFLWWARSRRLSVEFPEQNVCILSESRGEPPALPAPEQAAEDPFEIVGH